MNNLFNFIDIKFDDVMNGTSMTRKVFISPTKMSDLVETLQACNPAT